MSRGRGSGRGGGSHNNNNNNYNNYNNKGYHKAPLICFQCGKEGHFARDCRSFQQFEEEDEKNVLTFKSKVPFVDTHCHLDYILQKYQFNSVQELFKKKNNFGENYGGCVNVYCDPVSFSDSFSTWKETLDNQDLKIFGAFGLHPHNAKYFNEKLSEKIQEALKHPRAVAWGECGLDFVKNVSTSNEQISAFKQQLVRAVEIGKPVVVHSRNAESETFDILSQCLPSDWKIHTQTQKLHCFSDSEVFAEKYLKTFPNMMFGVTGAITFKNATKARDIIRNVIPLNKILLETDAPYMIPNRLIESKSGLVCGGPVDKSTCSDPGHIPFIAMAIAQIKGVDVESVLETARVNTTKMYGF